MTRFADDHPIVGKVLTGQTFMIEKLPVLSYFRFRNIAWAQSFNPMLHKNTARSTSAHAATAVIQLQA